MKISRQDAIKLFCRVTDKDDPYWINLVEEFCDDESDDWPTIYDVLGAIGVSRDEIDKAEGAS